MIPSGEIPVNSSTSSIPQNRAIGFVNIYDVTNEGKAKVVLSRAKYLCIKAVTFAPLHPPRPGPRLSVARRTEVSGQVGTVTTVETEAPFNFISAFFL